MGMHMAKNLVKNGHSVVGFDVNKSSVDKFVAGGAGRGAASPKEVAQSASVVVTMLPSSPHVQQVYEGANGVFEGIKSGALLIDSSTIDPLVARKLSAAAQTKGVSLLDAPVSGGVGGAEAGTLTFMVGADTLALFARAEPLLRNMGKNVVHCGGAGTGQIAKICNNLILAISMAGVSEAMGLGVALGMDPKVLAGIINTSSGRCWSSDTYNPVPGVMQNVPSSRGYAGGFAVDLMAKDISLATGAAHAVKAPVPLGGAVQQLYNLLSRQGYGSKDFSSVYEFLAQKKN